jgi:hypothetical protein
VHVPSVHEYTQHVSSTAVFTPKSVSFGYRLWNRTWVGAQRSRSGEHMPKPSTYKITEHGLRTEHDTLSS